MPNPQVGLRELPLAIQNFRARPIEPHDVVSTVHDWLAVVNHAIATPEGGSRWLDQTNLCAIVG